MNMPITIVMTTYFPATPPGKLRYDVANKTLKSWEVFFRYDGEMFLHIADDGSQDKLSIKSFWGNPVTYSTQKRRGVGASLNQGFATSFLQSPIVFMGVDDWHLTENFDLTPWAQLLFEREDVGMVRFSPPHPNIRGHVEAFTSNIQSWGLRLDRYGFAFGHRPALYHKRMIDHYGRFAENTNALECERLYNEHFNTTPGPDIVLALPSSFMHLDSVELAYLEPGDGNV